MACSSSTASVRRRQQPRHGQLSGPQHRGRRGEQRCGGGQRPRRPRRRRTRRRPGRRPQRHTGAAPAAATNTRQVGQRAPNQSLHLCARHSFAQAILAHLERRDDPADKKWFKGSPAGFDFREFRHAGRRAPAPLEPAHRRSIRADHQPSYQGSRGGQSRPANRGDPGCPRLG